MINISEKKGKNHIINPTVRSKIIFGIAAIFKKLHEQNVIFRDLKLSKIGLDEYLEPKILHNISAKIIKEPTNGFVGTPLFMAPELFSHDSGTYSFPIDVYAFAVMLYSMFEKEFTIDNMIIKKKFILVKKISGGKRFDKSKKIPEPYWELINMCWKQNPDERPTFSEIVEILKHDKFAIEEFGMRTNLDELHEYQNRIDA